MNRIELVSQGRSLASIEFRNHPFVNKWFEHWKYINSNFQPYMLNYLYPSNSWRPAPSIDIVKKSIDSIRDAGLYLNSITNTHIFPYDLDNFPSYDIFLENGLEAQQYLNTFHRHFTNGVREPYGKDLLKNGMIKKEEDASNWINRIQEINQAVHDLDCHTRTPHSQSTTILKYFGIQYHLNDENMYLSKGVHCSITPEECLSAADDSNNWNVWLKVDLLGKDYITGFINHDNPTEWDIQYLNNYTGMFVLYPNKTPVDFCKNKIFHKWLQKYDLEYDPRMCGIPLGKINHIIDDYYNCPWNYHNSDLLIQEL